MNQILRHIFVWGMLFFSSVEASEFSEQLSSSENLSSFLMCGKRFFDLSRKPTKKVYQRHFSKRCKERQSAQVFQNICNSNIDCFQNHFDWIGTFDSRNCHRVIKKCEFPDSIWWCVMNLEFLLRELDGINPKTIWIAGNDVPWLSNINKNTINRLIETGADIYYESKNIEHSKIHLGVMGFVSQYLELVDRSKIHESVYYSEEFFHKKKGVLGAWGKVWPSLEEFMLDRKLADKFASKADFVDRKMIDYDDWWQELASYRFLISPLGKGLQSSRAWEALLVQTIPILINVPANRELKELGFPVVLVDDWNEITEELLDIWWEELSPKLAEARWMLTNQYWKNKVLVH